MLFLYHPSRFKRRTYGRIDGVSKHPSDHIFLGVVGNPISTGGETRHPTCICSRWPDVAGALPARLTAASLRLDDEKRSKPRSTDVRRSGARDFSSVAAQTACRAR